MYQAYVDGRSEQDPSTFWYEGEIGFFDFYMYVTNLEHVIHLTHVSLFGSCRLMVYSIPLARKLKECGVFGVSSDECLNYAMKNRAEWKARGREVVAEMVKAIPRTC